MHKGTRARQRGDMSDSMPSKFGVPAAAAAAIGLAAYAWVGPMWFTGVPQPRERTIGTPSPDAVEGPGPAVGTVRPVNFSQFVQTFRDLRPPERVRPEEPEPDDPPDDQTPEPDARPDDGPGPLASWRYAGYLGTDQNLTAILTLPNEEQVTARAGETVAFGIRPVVSRVTRESVVFEVEDRQITIRLANAPADPSTPDTERSPDPRDERTNDASAGDTDDDAAETLRRLGG